MSDIRSICVFCGASGGNSPIYTEAARELGGSMAENGLRLVFGGGSVGMMGTVADAVMAGGGEAIGIIPEFLYEREMAHQELTDLRVVDSMHTRKRTMFDLSDAFIVLPGGFGTLEEMFEMITWRQLGRHTKPIVLISTDGYWSAFEDMIATIVERDFAHSITSELFSVVPNPDAAIRLLKS